MNIDREPHQSEQRHRHEHAQHESRARPATRRTLIVALATIVALFAIILFPGHPQRLTFGNFARLPLEWPLLVLALLLASARWQTPLRVAIVTLLGLLVLLRIADIGSYIAFDRRFSPLVEWHLIGDGWNLASGSIGTGEAALAALLALGLLVLLCVALFRGLGAIGRLQGTSRRNVASIGVATLILGSVAFGAQRIGAMSFPVDASLVPELVDRSKAMSRSIADQRAFVIELANDPVDEVQPPGFGALAGRDLIVLFIESYGRSFIDDPDLGIVAQTRLDEVGERLDAAGLHTRSGWLESPIRGGRSWLAHATFASGLVIDNQARFDRLVASQRRSLYRLLGGAGWRTAGLNPAIVEPWPEGVWYGYDTDYDLHTLGYAGQKFGWVTMPDQYTLSYFERQIRQKSDRPMAAELALISSHAPWTPLPTLVPWDDVGDGSVFDGSHRFGDAPVWSDRQKVRTLYGQSLDYSLAAIGEYLERHGKGALFIVLGDHQPASIIAGWGKTADVPVHVISDDAALLERLPDDWFSEGMQPDAQKRSRPMASMRAFLSQAFE